MIFFNPECPGFGITEALGLSQKTGQSLRLYLPGWATDYRVFAGSATLFGSYDEGMCVYMAMANPQWMQALIAVIAQSEAPPWQLIGLSLGGFMALEVAAQCGDRVATVCCVGIRERYEASLCRVLQRQLLKNRDKTVRDFLSQAYGCDDDVSLRERRVDEAALAVGLLSDGLSYLAAHPLTHCQLSCPVTCFHGEQDRIAPLAEAQALAIGKGWDFHVLPNLPHIPF